METPNQNPEVKTSPLRLILIGLIMILLIVASFQSFAQVRDRQDTGLRETIAPQELTIHH